MMSFPQYFKQHGLYPTWGLEAIKVELSKKTMTIKMRRGDDRGYSWENSSSHYQQRLKELHQEAKKVSKSVIVGL